MMMVFPLVGFAFLLLADRGPEARAGKGSRFVALGITTVLALLFLIPPLLWNAQNDWITFQHTSEHFDAGKPTALKQASRFLEFLGSQLGIFSPLTWILLLAVACVGLRRVFQLERRAAFLVLFSAPGILALILLAIRQKANPNWPAVFYVSAFVLLAAWLRSSIDLRGSRPASAAGRTPPSSWAPPSPSSPT